MKPDLWQWRYSILDKMDSFCHRSDWVPYAIQSRVCDRFDAVIQGGNSYRRLRQERKTSDANR